MSDEVQARPRTNTRLRAEAPPGLALSEREEGRKTIGRYEVIKTIGKGAMGVVYKARDPLLDRVVAVKTIMSPQQQGRRVRSAFLERFQREAKAAAKMSHPAIVTIFDVGLDEDSGAPFMVLEYLPGESLADRLDRVRLPLARCVQIGLDLSSALAFAHRQRIVHRDVKPANVLHAGDNRWKLADFGIARLPDSDLTQVGIFMGTPGYSPPEAIREGRYTPQADVFAWGAVMYELMSGRIPYEGPDTKTTNGYVVQGNAPPPTRHDPSIPEPLSTVAMTALQPSATGRFKDASEAEQALREAWERCLTQGLVHPAVLAMDEMSHDKAAVRFHEARGVSRLAPASFGDSDSVTAIDDKIPAKAAAAAAAAKPKQLIVEGAKRRAGDDDPTTLMVREEGQRKPDSTSRGVAPPGKAGPQLTEQERKTERVRVDKIASADPARKRELDGDPKVDQPTDMVPPISPRRVSPLLIAALVLLALAGAAAGLYFGHVIH
ncbi:MAG: serine/threonine protein kinase [Myxococcales bacterium]|nr:serine/threonine protein kinase [Myxococcales bacterium]